MIKKIAVGSLAILAIILLLAAMQPDSFGVRRSTTIKAPPARIIALINDFRSWSSWSPWEQLDPNMKRSFAGPPNGKGAVYSWEGNKDVGAGRMEITDMSAPARVVIKLDFLKPLEAHNTTEFTLQPQGELTTVTWNMTGPMPFVSKIMSVFMSMDAMIGKDFEKGLANMKAVAERQALQANLPLPLHADKAVASVSVE
jgi:uncharacterized protein YndB with AHSA1/START domain